MDGSSRHHHPGQRPPGECDLAAIEPSATLPGMAGNSTINGYVRLEPRTVLPVHPSTSTRPTMSMPASNGELPFGERVKANFRLKPSTPSIRSTTPPSISKPSRPCRAAFVRPRMWGSATRRRVSRTAPTPAVCNSACASSSRFPGPVQSSEGSLPGCPFLVSGYSTSTAWRRMSPVLCATSASSLPVGSYLYVESLFADAAVARNAASSRINASINPRGIEGTMSRLKQRGQRSSPGRTSIGTLTFKPEVYQTTGRFSPKCP